MRFFLLLACLASLRAAAQVTPVVPDSGAAPASAGPVTRPHDPSAYRNQTAAPVVSPVVRPALSAQDRRAFENCPDPRRFGPKGRKKLVRIR
jgi:hypothetical protein